MNFEEEYKKLNKAQKEAVEAIDGPVMVVAGPGTGKTQVLAMRILNILDKGAGQADEVLCLTFTNSGARAMRARLETFLGAEAYKVRISTFHAFAIELIEKYFTYLKFPKMPELLSDDEAVFLIDEILNENTWEHIRPRTNPEMYFRDLRSLISVLKRERLSHQEFLKIINEEIKDLKDNPENISSRGERKGELKKEILNKIESLEKTIEVVKFYEIYEDRKKEENKMDYDDVLEYAVELALNFEDVKAEIKENHQYILVDEHQDSSGVQNSFLRAVWQDEEKPNIFVVGDDRQLIYAFSGANINYFEEFKHIFGRAKLITLTENYRSHQNILDLSHDLLESTLVSSKLSAVNSGKNEILLNEYSYPRDEILGAGLYFKQKIAEGVAPEDCAVLVPKNHHVRSAIRTLSDMGLPVSKGKVLSLFELEKTQAILRVLEIVASSTNSRLIAESLLHKSAGIKPLDAHKFLYSIKADKLTIEELKKDANKDIDLFSGENAIVKWGGILGNFVNEYTHKNILETISGVGNYFIDTSENHEELLEYVETVRTLIHLSEMYTDKHPTNKLKEFLEYLKRLEGYGSHIPVATFGGDAGVQVMTLHASKGLEYQCVWVAHMNEETLMSEKRSPFTLPEHIKEHISKKDKEIAKRELYVAITRAREFCVISYAHENYTGGELELAEILRELKALHFVKKNRDITEAELRGAGERIFVNKKIADNSVGELEVLQKFVKENYDKTKVSVTLLNNFFECSWKWYFRNFLKLPEIKSSSLALGSAVHETIEYILKEKKLPADKKITEYLKHELEKEIIDTREVGRLLRDAENAVKNFIQNFYKNISPKYESERPLSFRDPKFNHLLMYGKIDLTEFLADGTVAVTDFKTGSSKTKSAIEKVDEDGRLSTLMRQLAMYTYLVRGGDKKEVSNSKLLFLEADKNDKNALYATRVDDEQIDLLVRDIVEYDEALKNGSWVERPCLAKSWGKNTECEYCKRAEIYKK